MKRVLAGAGVALLVAVTGCGGSDAPTKAEYIKKADAICKTGNAKIEAATSSLGADSSKAEIVKVITESVLPNIESQAKQLKALDKPKGDEDTINAIYASLDKALADGKADPNKLAGASDPFADANAKAKAYGMKVCGQG